MKFILIFLSIFTIEVNAKTISDYFYEKCMEADIKKRNITTEEEKKEIERKKSKEEMEKETIKEEEIVTHKILDITIIETNTTKTLIIKNKSYCAMKLRPELFKNEEIRKLKEFEETIKIKENEEVKITKIK